MDIKLDSLWTHLFAQDLFQSSFQLHISVFQREHFEADYVPYYLDRADVEALLSLDEPKKYLKVLNVILRK